MPLWTQWTRRYATRKNAKGPSHRCETLSHRVASSLLRRFPRYFGLLSTGPPLPYLAVSHVCRWWRSVALNDASLWTTPSFNNRELVLAMLERSQGAPLRIIVDTREPIDRTRLSKAIEDVMLHSHHVLSVVLEVDSGQKGILAGHWSRPFPMLRTLVIHHRDDYPNDPSHLTLEERDFPQL